MVSKKRSLCSLTIGEILEVHAQYSDQPNTMAEVIGDGFLYRNSPIFKSVRDACLELGYRYEMNPPFPYNSFPLVALTDILEQKIIPVLGNLHYIKKLESKRPRTFRAKDLRSVGPQGNFLLHESSHCIAHAIVGGPPQADWAYQSSSERSDIVKIMLAESFANSTEFMAASFLKKSAMEQWMIGCNMYFGLQVNCFSKLARQIGLPSTAKLSILLFLYANFLAVGLEPTGEKKIFDIIGIDKSLRRDGAFRKNFNEVKKQAFSLNPGFRVMTTELYLKQLGFTKSLSRLLSFDPMDVILRSSEMQGGLEKLSRVIDGTFVADQTGDEKAAAIAA